MSESQANQIIDGLARSVPYENTIPRRMETGTQSAARSHSSRTIAKRWRDILSRATTPSSLRPRVTSTASSQKQWLLLALMGAASRIT